MPTIAEIMSPDVQVVSPEQSLQSAARLMRECDVGALPVCDGQRLLGMVTDRDIAVRGVAMGLAPEDGCVSDVMSLVPQSCTTDQDAKAVMRVMAENQIRRLPVVDSDQQVVGIVSLSDLALRQSAPIEQTVRAISEPRPAPPELASPVVPVAATALLLALAWLLSDVLLLAFGGCLLALGLRRLSQPLQRRLHLSPRWALALVILALVLLLVLAFGVAGSAAAEQVQTLRETLPKALQALRAWLGQHAPGRWLLAVWRGAEVGPDDWSRLANVAGGTVNLVIGVLGSTALLVALGIYLAADPALYRRGFLRLWPARRRALAERTLDAAGADLSRWLMGQAVSMLAVGMLTAVGLALIGMPLALSLGVIAALLDFVPYFGPIVSGVLVVAVALTEGQTQALWAAGVCLAVQQIESYLVQPLVQKWAVRLPPVLGMLAVLVFGLLFGLPGVLLAVPLMVLSMTLVEHLWVQRGADAPH